MILRKDGNMRTQPYYGQMSSIYFFSTPVPRHEDVASIFHLGYNFDAIRSNDQENRVIVGQYGNQFWLDSKRYLKIQFYYHPKAVFNQNKCLEVSSYDYDLINNIFHTPQSYSIQYAIKLPGTSSIRTHGCKESLYCVGGIRILLPLFTLLHSSSSPYFNLLKGLETNTTTSGPPPPPPSSSHPPSSVNSTGPSSFSQSPSPSSLSTSYLSSSSRSLQIQSPSSLSSPLSTTTSMDPLFTVQIFHLLENMLIANQQNQQQMVLFEGFEIIGYLLEFINPKCWNKIIIDSFHNLSYSIMSFEPLYRQFILNIYFNFHIWIYTPFEFQKELIEKISEHMKKEKFYFRNIIGIQKIIDLLRSYYWFTVDHYSLATKPIIHPLTLESLGTRPNYNEIKQIRISLLQLINIIISPMNAPSKLIHPSPSSNDHYPGLKFTELKALVLYLVHCQDAEQGIDILQILLAHLCQLYSNPQQQQQHSSSSSTTSNSKYSQQLNEILEYILSLGGILPFIELLKRRNSLLRVWCLKLIGKLIEIASICKKKEKLIGGYTGGIVSGGGGNHSSSNVSTTSSSSSSSSSSYNYNKIILIKSAMELYPLQEISYFALLEILLECINNREFKNPIHMEKEVLPLIKNGEIIPIIFEKLCTSSQSSLQLKVLQDFVYLLSQSIENRREFLRNPFWQNWLLGILANDSSSSSSSTSATPSMSTTTPSITTSNTTSLTNSSGITSSNPTLNNTNQGEVIKQVVKLFTILFHHLLSEPNGW